MSNEDSLYYYIIYFLIQKHIKLDTLLLNDFTAHVSDTRVKCTRIQVSLKRTL